MSKYRELAFIAITLLAILAVVYMAAWSPSARCANTQHRVYVSDEQACLPVNAFVPAR